MKRGTRMAVLCSVREDRLSLADRQIGRFAWSRDGKQLAVFRGINAFDIVLMSNFN
jgi:hypothetical protein